MPKYEYQDRKGGCILPAGTYIADVLEAEDAFSTKGDPQIKMKIRLLGGSEGDGLCWENLTFVEKALWRVDSFLKATAAPPPLGTQVDLSAAQCVGRRARVKVIVSQSNSGTDRNEIKQWLPWVAGDAELVPISLAKPEWPAALQTPSDAKPAADDLPF